MKVYNYTVIMTPDETGGYVVTCPALPGLVTEGDTLEEARMMTADAIMCYLEGLISSSHTTPKI
jgi:predicted RNase H-like HicB family nuclease